MVVGSLVTINPSNRTEKKLSAVYYHEGDDTFSFVFRKKLIKTADPDKAQAEAQKLSQDIFINFDEKALGEIGYIDKLNNTQKS